MFLFFALCFSTKINTWERLSLVIRHSQNSNSNILQSLEKCRKGEFDFVSVAPWHVYVNMKNNL